MTLIYFIVLIISELQEFVNDVGNYSPDDKLLIGGNGDGGIVRIFGNEVKNIFTQTNSFHHVFAINTGDHLAPFAGFQRFVDDHDVAI